MGCTCSGVACAPPPAHGVMASAHAMKGAARHMHFLTWPGPALALAVPFLFSSTRAPLTNFWPLMCAWLCAGVLALLLVWQVRRPDAPGRHALARPCAAGVLLAALLGSAVGLLQYFGQTDGWWGWLHPAQPGVAMGQLRQRNQQASFLSLGLWALWWVVAQSIQGQVDQGTAVRQGTRSMATVGLGLLVAWALALLAVGSAATASRTGLAAQCPRMRPSARASGRPCRAPPERLAGPAGVRAGQWVGAASMASCSPWWWAAAN